jgi:hypothetical protein
MSDHEDSPETRQRMEDLRHATRPVDPDAPRTPLCVIGFQPFDGNELAPIHQYEMWDETPHTWWDVTIMLNDRDLWLLHMLDRSHGIVPEVSGSTYVTIEEAYNAALQAAGEPMPSR